MIGNHCYQIKGRIEKDNLTKQERAGIREAKESGYVFNITDKSKECYVDTDDNYKKSMNKHVGDDKKKVKKNLTDIP